MSNDISMSLDNLGNLVKAANLSVDVSHSVQWCLDQLPSLFQQFGEGYENRIREEILRLEHALMAKVSDEAKTNADLKPLVESLKEHLRQLHEQVGLQEPETKTPRIARPRAKRAA